MTLSRFASWLLLGPALALLGLVFLVPLVGFITGALREIGGWAEIWEQVELVLLSGSMRRSLLVTFWISLGSTLGVLAVGYPLAYALVRARGLAFAAIIGSVILPYFTSIIVRTYAWIVLLGRSGIVNDALLRLGLIDAPVQLLYNRFAVTVGMAYLLLPYMVLTLYAAMRGVDSGLLQAAAGMGASKPRIFLRVFLPLTLHGVFAGVLIVFILAVGFFVTPALMGAPSDMMIGMLIERQVELANNWPVAAIMSLVLLAVTLVLYAVYTRFADTRRGLLT